jgi:hypothetical protein
MGSSPKGARRCRCDKFKGNLRKLAGEIAAAALEKAVKF